MSEAFSIGSIGRTMPMTVGTTVYRAGFPQPMKVTSQTPLGIVAQWIDEFGEKHKAIFDPKELRVKKQ